MLDPNIIRVHETRIRRRLEDLRYRVEHGRISKDEAREVGRKAIQEHEHALLTWVNSQFLAHGLPQVTRSPEQQKALEDAMERWDRAVDDMPTVPGS